MRILADLLRALTRGREDGFRARLRRWLRGAGARRPDAETEAPPPARAPEVAVPEGFVAVARVSDIPPGGLSEVLVHGVPVVLCNVAGTFHAVSAVCPHAGGPLGDGTLADATLTCPLHGWSYDVRDGRCHVDAATRLPTHQVRVIDGAVCVRPDAGS